MVSPPENNSSVSEKPEGTANNAPIKGKINQAKIPCISQKHSHDQFLTLLIGT
ncbi:hypothetical protein KL86DYS1_30357 [uncultured Dysgonomonas sp.]|uniref:Uncharacterized protein n=1 Tax=uncultured Dysgonomonas sp. TaxID=206096 RepID=A0A212JT39_9BACT|nr:hypothetical protein KL86DYS1_30357 [uncultured Dysgonomonas sp.]